jgi:hypothetical protein
MTSGFGSEHGGLPRAPRNMSSQMWYLGSLVCLNVAAAVFCGCAANAFPSAVDGYVYTGIFCALNTFGLSVFGYVKCLVWCGRIIDAQHRARASHLGVGAAAEPIDPRPFLGWLLSYCAALYILDELATLNGVPRFSFGYAALLAASIVIAVRFTGRRFALAACAVYDSNLKSLSNAEKLVLLCYALYVLSWFQFMCSLGAIIALGVPHLAVVVMGCSPLFAGVFFAFAMMHAANWHLMTAQTDREGNEQFPGGFPWAFQHRSVDEFDEVQ